MTPRPFLDLCRSEIAAGGYVVISMSDDGRTWAYSVGLHRSFGHPELYAEGVDGCLGGSDAQELEGLVDLLCGAVVLGETVGGTPVDRAVGPAAAHAAGGPFAFGRLILAELGSEWPTAIQVGRASLSALADARHGTAQRSEVLECRVPSGHLVDRIPGAQAPGRQPSVLDVPGTTRTVGDAVTGLESARNHLWPSTSVTALSTPITALR